MLTLLVPSSAGKGKSAQGQQGLLIVGPGGLKKIKLDQCTFDAKTKMFSGTLRVENLPFKYVNDSLIVNSAASLELTSLSKAGEVIASLYDEFDKLLETAPVKEPVKSDVQRAVEGAPIEKAHTINDKRAEPVDKKIVPAQVKLEQVEVAKEPVEEAEYVEVNGVNLEIDKETKGLRYEWGLADVSATKYPNAWVLAYLSKGTGDNPDQLMILSMPITPDEDSNLYLFFNDEQVCKDAYKRMKAHKRHKEMLIMDKSGNTKFQPTAIKEMIDIGSLEGVAIHFIRSSKRFLNFLETVEEPVTK